MPILMKGHNIVVLDLETRRSADDCNICGLTQSEHSAGPPGESLYCPRDGDRFSAIGWNNKALLGLSIGCYFDYKDMLYHWFDAATLYDTVVQFVTRKPLLVSFNGIQFDFSLMRALLRQDAWEATGYIPVSLNVRQQLCDEFKALCATSYDILAEIWRLDPAGRFVKELNSLDAIRKANGMPAKTMDGATAPRLWAEGRYAEVLNYCQGDVQAKKQLFEWACSGRSFLRGNGLPITLPLPQIQA